MSTGPEQDPTTDKKEAFVPAYKAPEGAPKTDEELRAEYVANRTKTAERWTEASREDVDQINAENPRSFVEKLTRRNKPVEAFKYTERDIAELDAIHDNEALEAEKAASEKAKADAAVEKEAVRVDADRKLEEMKKTIDLHAELSEARRAKEEAISRLYPSQVDMNIARDIWLTKTTEPFMPAAEKSFKEAEARHEAIYTEIRDIDSRIGALEARFAELKHGQAKAA